ncbi:hypothetical protein GYMLUDRAFT_470850 [Collybiopsis luxurians FD-317 M1]|uniref:Uncharacterized protein n=1 Tax=Collybiopsis luxurians FD-317 M1 TaxID=944289 RepID=A0A0D0D1D5_9AGAR|nr:hypothetical protein GYMLUDRAFT_470850 [Collybiopsis luxurians FD-317 M1]
MDTPKKSSASARASRIPKSKASTPPKASSGSPMGHYTPHSRQRAQSSFSILSSPSPTSKLQVLIPAPESYPPPSLVRYRSESNASGASSTGTGSHSHSGSTSDSTLFTPESSAPPTSVWISRGFNGSQFDISEPYAVTMSLLSESSARNPSQSPPRNPSPSRFFPAKTESQERTPKAAKTKEKGAERPMSPASSMLRLARFFSGKNTKTTDGSPPPKTEKPKPASPPPKVSPSRGRGRTRKLSATSINISSPVTPPVSIPMGQDLRQAIPGFPIVSCTKPGTRQRSQTTSGLPSPTTSTLPISNRSAPHSGASSTGASGQASSARANEFGVMSDQEMEEEIRKDLNMSRLKPWTASIPRKRSSLSLSILPGQHESNVSEPILNGACDKAEGEDVEGSLATCETKWKGSGESAVSAGSMGSSYINVLRAPEGTGIGSDAERGKTTEEVLRPVRGPMPPRSKTTGPPKSSGISGMRFPGFRRAQTTNDALGSSQSTVVSSSAAGSVRGLRISSPMLQVSPAPQAKESATGLVSSSTTALIPPAVQQTSKGHGRAKSDSGISTFDRESIRCASPIGTLGDCEPTSSIQLLPSASELDILLSLPLLDESGQKIAFGDVLNIPGVESGKTVIVLFLRHFWCPFDQDYVQEVGDLLRRLAEDRGKWQLSTEVGKLRIGKGKGQKELPDVVIVSNGSSSLISKYKEIFDLGGDKLRIRMYTDPACDTYGVLGMGNLGEACVNDGSTSRPSSPFPPSLKQSSTPSPPGSPSSRRGVSSSKYEAGIPLVRTDHRTPPRPDTKGHRKSNSLGPNSASLLPSAGATSMLRPRSRSPSPANRSSMESTPLSRSVSPAPSTSGTEGHRSYIKHASVIGGIASVVKRAIKVGMPVWEKSGAIRQLGGELVFRVVKDSKSLDLQVECAYAHRMQNAQDHTPFGEVLKISLTTSSNNIFVSFCTSTLDWTAQLDAQISPASCTSSEYPSSAPPYSIADVSRVTHSAPCSPTKASTNGHPASTSKFSSNSKAGPTDKEDLSKQYNESPSPEISSTKFDSELDPPKDGMASSWGDQLYTLRAGTDKDTSESIRGIRARDSVRSSTGSLTSSSIRAMRAIRAPRGPRMRMHSVSAESLVASPSHNTVRSFGSGMEGIESVLEYGESISSPDLSLLRQSAIHPRSSNGRWRRPYAMESTSTLDSSVYYDADEGVAGGAGRGATDDEEEGVAVDVLPVTSRSPSRLFHVVNSPEVQDRTLDSIDSEYSTASAPDRTELLTSICSEPLDEEEEEEKLRELLLVRASSSMRGRGVFGGA